MLVVQVSLKDYDNGSQTLNRLPIKTSKETEVEVISGGDRDHFLELCGRVWDKHHGAAET